MTVTVDVEADGWRSVEDVVRLVEDTATAALKSAHPGESGEAGTVSPGAPPASGSLSVLLADDAAVHELNRRWRGQDRPTNVLSFPAPASAAPHLGDVALAYGTCAREAAEQDKPLAHHLTHLVAHGVLHLLGWDHQSDAEAESMEALERDILARLGVPDPYGARDTLLHG